MNLTNRIATRRVAPNDGATTTFQLAAGTSDVNSVSVDTLGYAGCRLIVAVGAMAASSSLDVKLQDSSDNSSFSDVAGTAATQVGASDDDKLVIIDVYRPLRRYLRLAFVRGDGGNSAIDGVIAELYEPLNAAPAAHSTVHSQEIFATPERGTA